MNTNDTSPGMTSDNGWLEDWGGIFTVDNGYPSAYDHEALAGRDGDAITLTCQCGTWTGYAPAAEGDAEYMFAEWRNHVHANIEGGAA